MPQKRFGTKGQIEFTSDNEFFEALGLLSKNDGTTALKWENNEEQGAWGSEGRIHCYKDLHKFPSYFNSAFSAGVGNILRRINCNEYVIYIRQHYGFELGSTQNVAAIRAAIPPSFHADFDRGIAL